MGERLVRNEEVVSSILIGSTNLRIAHGSGLTLRDQGAEVGSAGTCGTSVVAFGMGCRPGEYVRAKPPFFDDGKSGRAAFPEGSAEFDRILNERGCERVTQFYRYWQSRKSGNLPPRRRDIDPIDIPQLLANTLLLEIIGQPAADFRYRLIGTRISDFDSANFTGMLLSEVIPRQAAFDCVWEHHLHAARGQVEIRIDTNKWLQDNSRATISYLILLLPLRGEADDIEMLFGYIHYFLDAQDARPAG